MKKAFPVAGLSLTVLLSVGTSIRAQFVGQDPKSTEKTSSAYKSPDRNDRRSSSDLSQNGSTQPSENDEALQAQRLFEAGTASYQAGKLDDAIAALSQAAKLRPEDSQTHFHLGMAYSQAKAYKEAADAFKKAVKLKPDWPEANFRLGMMSYVLGRKGQSVDSYNKLVKLNSPLANTLYRIIKDEESVTPPATPTNASSTSATKNSPEPVNVPVSKKESRKSTSARREEVTSPTESVALKPAPKENSQPTSPAPKDNPQPLTAAPAVRAVSVDQNLTGMYRVGVGDILDVRLLNSSMPGSTLFTVIDGGLIELPIAGGPISVSGLTTNEIQSRIATELKRRAVEGNASVSVGVRQYVSHTVIVTGLVANTGARVLRREAIPLYVLMAEVQPRSDAGRVTILRAGSPVINLDLHQSSELGTLVLPGDVINIGPRPQEYYYIGGRVNYPGQKQFQLGITLLQAILAAGGTAHNDNTIDVSREAEGGRLTTTRYKLKDIKSGKTEDPKLQPGDRIEVVH